MKKGKRFGCLKVFAVFLLVIAVLIGGSYTGFRVFFNYRNRIDAAKSEEALMQNVILDIDWDFTPETLPKEYYDLDFDGDGLTNGEEILLGTDMYKVDTDGDGLSDYDEVHIYKSDPLKISTADDGISDLIKAVLGLDFHKAYDSGDLVSGPVELSENVRFVPGDLNSEHLFVYELYEGNLFEDAKMLVPPFFLHHGEGRIIVDLKQGFDSKNTSVYFYDTENQILVREKNVKFTETTLEFGAKSGLPVAILDKNQLPYSMLHSGKSSFDSEQKKEYYLVLVPFSNYDTTTVPDFGIGDLNVKSFFKEKDTVFILEVDNIQGIRNFNGNTELENSIMKKSDGWLVDHYYLQSLVYDFAKNTYNGFLSSNDKRTQELLTEIPVKRVETTLRGLENEVIAFILENGYSAREIVLGIYDARSGFNVKEHGFVFSNLSTTVSPNGVCAGFSFLARQGFNGFSLPRTASGYSFMQYSTPGYNASGSVFNVVFNGLLGSFVPQSAALKAKGDDIFNDFDSNYIFNASAMSDPDKTIVDLLNYYWLFNNGERIKFEHSSGVLKTYDYNFSAIQDISNEFKSGRVVEMGVFGGIGGHAIVGYDLRQDFADPNRFYMGVYDSNFPENKRFAYAGRQLVRVSTDVVMVIERYPKRVSDGAGNLKTDYFFRFDYTVGSGSYRWSNVHNPGDRVVFYKTGTNQHSVFVR